MGRLLDTLFKRRPFVLEAGQVAVEGGSRSQRVSHVRSVKKETSKDIDLIVNSGTRVDLQLPPGVLTDTIEVTGAPPILQPDSAATSEKIERSVPANVPLISSNRNFSAF